MKNDDSQKQQKQDKTKTEKYILEEGFTKPVCLWTYDGSVLVKKRMKVRQYDIRIDGGKTAQKLDVLFAFSREEYDDIKKGISVNEKIEAQQHKPIVERKDRPAVASERKYIRGTGKDVQITLRTGHVLSGHQVYATKYTIILRINDKIVLVYKHGILQYEKPNSKSEETQDG